MTLKKHIDITGAPLRGGAITAKDRALLPFGQFSWVQNLRQRHPGLETRKGQARLHTTADGSNEVMTLYQWKKAYTSETKFYAQMGDGDVLEATNAPPTVTTGVFGSEVFSGGSGQIPASWTNIGDILVYSNGVDQHQVFGGSGSYVVDFFVVKAAAAIPVIPESGVKYSTQVADGDSTTVAILDSLGDLDVDYDCIFIRTPVPATSFTWTIPAPNTTASVADVHFWNGSAWTDVANFADTTANGTPATLAVTGGTMSWDAPTTEQPKYLYGTCGYWYQVHLTSGDLDAEVEVSGVTFGSEWTAVQNVWDGIPVQAVEAYVYNSVAYELYPGSTIEVDEMETDWFVYFATADPIDGFYVDTGLNPNENGGAINVVASWDGSAWGNVSGLVDGTDGMTHAGWVTWTPPGTEQPLQFQGSKYQAYWYRFSVSVTLSDDMTLSIQTMPRFTMTDFGKSRCSVAWKDRVGYTFTQFPQFLYMSKANAPLSLNGFDYGILEAGDGRAHKIVAMRRFYNELMVWQEEKGSEGGCLTLFEGYSPTTFGKLVLTSRLGTMNNKSVAVVDGILMSTASEEKIKTLCFFLSRYGVCVTDGRTISIISDDIQNYFDPQKSECIRRGYEDKMWLEHDTTENVIRIGLVSGASATTPNVFPVLDLVDKTWSFDTPAQELSCMVNIDAGSGTAATVQVAGGVDDGFVYQLNTGDLDVSTAIDAYLDIELGAGGEHLLLREIMPHMKVQSAGDLDITVYKNTTSDFTRTLTMTAENSGDEMRRHRIGTNIEDQSLTLRLQSNGSEEPCYLYSLGVRMSIWKER